MKTQFITLAVLVASAIFVFTIQNWLFLNPLAGVLLGTNMDLQDFVRSASGPSFAILFISCIVAFLLWVNATTRQKPRSSAEVREMQPLWWLTFASLVGLGWLLQLVFTVLIWSGRVPPGVSGINYFPIPPLGWLLLLVSVVVDVFLLFWLPTLFASANSYRLVVPGAVKILGGR